MRPLFVFTLPGGYVDHREVRWLTGVPYRVASDN